MQISGKIVLPVVLAILCEHHKNFHQSRWNSVPTTLNHQGIRGQEDHGERGQRQEATAEKYAGGPTSPETYCGFDISFMDSERALPLFKATNIC